MKYDDIYNLASVSDTATANQLLEHGWKLLKITTHYDTDDRYYTQGIFQNSCLVIVLGATKTIAELYPVSKATERHYS